MPQGQPMMHITRCLLMLWLTVWGLAEPSLAATARYTVSTQTGNLLLTPAHGERGSAWGKANCQGCHVLRLIHANAPLIRPVVQQRGYQTCGGCHGDNGTGQTRRCLVCHNNQDLPLHPLQSGTHRHDFATGKDRPPGDGDCLLCHVKSDMDGRFELTVDLTPFRDADGKPSPYVSQRDFCLRCHNQTHQPRGVRIQLRPQYGLNDPLVTIEDNYRYIDRHGDPAGGGGTYSGLRGSSGYRYGQSVECTDCHVMHGTRNSNLLLDDSRKGVSQLNPLLRSKPYRAIESTPGNYAQVCVLCHRMDDLSVEDAALDTGNGLSGVHDARSDCGECHVHGQGFGGGL
jgi:hypothetical protein